MPNRIYKKVPVEVQNRSGSYCGHSNLFTSKCGTITPVLTDLLIPNTSVNLNMSCHAQFPPMATDFFSNVDLKFEAFFVPLRLCYGGFQDLVTHDGLNEYPSNTNDYYKPKVLPQMSLWPKDSPLATTPPSENQFGTGTLADYLGSKIVPDNVGNRYLVKNVLPFVAYHLIWQEWYRNTFIQKPAFRRPNSGDNNQTAKFLPYVSFGGESPISISTALENGSLWKLRQRNFEKDYFTNAKPKPESDGSQLAFRVDTTTGDGSFSIASLRSANALQMWLDRNRLAGFRYSDQMFARFGVRPSDATIDRPIYLGQQIVPVYTKGITQTADAAPGRQPFDSVGTQYGQSVAVGSGHLANFTTTEYGYIMVMCTLVPQAVYSTGTRRHLEYSTRADFADPLLQGIGDQTILKSELISSTPGQSALSETFGYTQRFAEYKDMQDEVHGLLRDGSSLDMFALQRGFDVADDVNLSSSFIEIPSNYLDQVTAVSTDSSEFGYMCCCNFDYNKVQPLAAYSIPTLGESKDTHTEVIDNGGVML